MLGKRKKDRICVRLIATPLPEEDVKKRLEKITRTSKKKGYVPNEESLSLLRWSICITNVHQSWVTDEQVYLLYSLRWQIELFFKLGKSEAKIHQFTSKNPERVQCELYAKWMSVVLLLYMCLPVRWQGEEEISWRKAYKQLKQQAFCFFNALRSSPIG